ncbi:homeobox-leucine zipper protein PROTODERMAL FACTOR 2-like [Actinidia eriantha]|uniref:homeobox-leucine zipper protein PROTODERMAL FACTOR 2-like n=1 Tax=Actinidia eriantha TaxID=165200 RepID=UPI002588F8FB|nr:homeobox-leucine zipper protein PROTODERMAL FACTOR 2-like [Actinidia eriantha]
MGSQSESMSSELSGSAEMEESTSASVSFMTPQNSTETNSDEEQSPMALGTDLHRASDLLVSVSVRAEVNRPKITNLVMAAMEELTQLALEEENMWLVDPHTGNRVINNVEYNRRFGPLDPALEEVLRLIKTEGPLQLLDLNNTLQSTEVGSISLQTEASIETGLVCTTPIILVEMFLNVEQWSLLFSSIVAEARLLEVLSRGEQENFDGAIQVIAAEFHVSSPLVHTREGYFARYCKQLGFDSWVVVDVSLESIFPNPATKFIRRPSGCVIQAVQNGYSKVTWIEHLEVDNTLVHHLFKPLVVSGYAFGAKRWIGTLVCQCDRVASYLDDRVMLMRDGRRNLLKLADRLVRNYYSSVSASSENVWKSIPVAGAEDILITTNYNDDHPEMPRGVSVTFTTTIQLPTQPNKVFEFLRSGDQRNQWDLLSVNCHTNEKARVRTGRNPGNCVSIVTIDNSPLIFYLQESRTNAAGSYVVYSPIDLFALNSVFGGENTDNIQMLASGFTILPDRPRKNGEEAGGTLLTIAFQILDDFASTPEYLPPMSVTTVYTILAETVLLLRASFLQ